MINPMIDPMINPISKLIRNRPALALLLALLLAPAAARASEVYVIANPAAGGLALADAKEIFLGRKQFAGAQALKPVDNAALQGSFLSQVLMMDKSKYASWWVKKSFQDGIAQPDTKSGDAEVLQYVRSTQGAVGYVGSPPPAGVTTLGKF